MMRKIKYRIFDYAWYIPVQTDLIKALQQHCMFDYCLNQRVQWTDEYFQAVKGNVNLVSHYTEGLYDVAILHVDQHVLSPLHQKRRIYDQLNYLIQDIPKIVVNHGMPIYNKDSVELQSDPIERQIDYVNQLQDLIDKNTMIVNASSLGSNQLWGFGLPVIHGIDTENWPFLPKEPRVITTIAEEISKYDHNRQFLSEVALELQNAYGYKLWQRAVNADADFSLYGNRQYTGRSLLYLDVAIPSLSRSRAEAFLSGCCVIRLEDAKDLEEWAIPNENIILVPHQAKEIAKVITHFLEDGYEKAVQIGKKGKEIAEKKYNLTQYRNSWLDLLKKVTN